MHDTFGNWEWEDCRISRLTRRQHIFLLIKKYELVACGCHCPTAEIARAAAARPWQTAAAGTLDTHIPASPVEVQAGAGSGCREDVLYLGSLSTESHGDRPELVSGCCLDTGSK